MDTTSLEERGQGAETKKNDISGENRVEAAERRQLITSVAPLDPAMSGTKIILGPCSCVNH